MNKRPEPRDALLHAAAALDAGREPPEEYKREFRKLRPLMVEIFFVHEIISQCESAEYCFDLIIKTRNENAENPNLLSLSHFLLVCGGNVAKLLKPSNDAPLQIRNRAKRIRESLGISLDELSGIRSARNFVEHFDERLERFVNRDLQRGVMSPAVVAVDGGAQQLDYLQLLISSSLELNLYDQKHNLHQFISLLNKIREASERLLNNLEERLELENQRLLERCES